MSLRHVHTLHKHNAKMAPKGKYNKQKKRYIMINVNRYKCCYCGACVSVCPNNALELAETWLDISKDCTNCHTCTSICPVGALEITI